MSRDDATSSADSVDSLIRAVASAPADPSAAIMPGDRFGRFEIEREIGRGSNGAVFRAHDLELDRVVALKVLRRPDAADRGRFMREGRAAAAVRHPGVVTLYEVGEDAGRPFLAMELVEGETLRARLRRGELTQGEALAIGRAIVEAVAAAHALGIVHRDLKPENVLLGASGAPRVVDFGLAKSLRPTPAADDKMTEEGHVVGTPGYMAPEQASGLDVSLRSDVFSLGVILYELTTGAQPFTGSTSLDVLVATKRDEPASPASRGVAGAMSRIIMRCLAKDPEARFKDATEVASALATMPPASRRLPIAAAGGLLVAAVVAAFASRAGTFAATASPTGAIDVATAAPARSSPEVLASVTASVPVPVPSAARPGKTPPAVTSIVRPASTRSAAPAVEERPILVPSMQEPPRPLDDQK